MKTENNIKNLCLYFILFNRKDWILPVWCVWGFFMFVWFLNFFKVIKPTLGRTSYLIPMLTSVLLTVLIFYFTLDPKYVFFPSCVNLSPGIGVAWSQPQCMPDEASWDYDMCQYRPEFVCLEGEPARSSAVRALLWYSHMSLCQVDKWSVGCSDRNTREVNGLFS